MEASTAFLQTNPFVRLNLDNACADSAFATLLDGPTTAPDELGDLLHARQLADSAGLHQRLIRGRLVQRRRQLPRLADGIDHTALAQELGRLLSGSDPLLRLLQPCGRVLHACLATLTLEPVVQLLLTAARQRHPASYQHAVRAMALAGALAWHVQAPADFLRLAMQAGLLHDIGEMYVEPAYLGSGRQLDLREYRQLAAHPQVGALLLSQLTACPPEVSRAVREHHERLDGTGYPFQLLGSSLSPLGQLLAIVELVLGIVDQWPAAAARAGFALKFVPGELSGVWAGPLTRWAESEPNPLPGPEARGISAADLAELDRALHRMEEMAGAVSARLDGASQRVALRAAHRLRRLRLAWNAMGLWSLPDDFVIEPRERFDIELAVRELRYRISTIGRDCLWPETDFKVLADARLVPLWTTLESAGAPRAAPATTVPAAAPV